MKRYVLLFPHKLPAVFAQEVVLIERQKADWQLGKLNLTGGGIKDGESVEAAAVRELREETGVVASAVDVQVLGVIDGGLSGYHVTVCFVPYRDWYAGQRQEVKNLAAGEGQILKMGIGAALADEKLIANLKLIIPLCQSMVKGWTLKPTADDNVWLVTLA